LAVTAKKEGWEPHGKGLIAIAEFWLTFYEMEKNGKDVSVKEGIVA